MIHKAAHPLSVPAGGVLLGYETLGWYDQNKAETIADFCAVNLL